MLNKVQGVSFPRAGHGLLAHALRLYFGCAWSYCEFYHHCGTRPCANGAVFSKSHDFNLLDPVCEDTLYLFQTRAPYPALASWYELHLREGSFGCSAAEWARFAREKARFYSRMMAKWSATNALEISYESLTAAPVDAISDAIRLFDPETPIVKVRLEAIVEQLCISAVRNTADFGYHSDVSTRRAIEEITGCAE